VVVFACGGAHVYSGEGDVVAVDDPPRHVTIRDVGAALVSLAVAPGERLVASAGADPVVRLHDADTGVITETLAWHRGGIPAVAWAGAMLVAGDTEGGVAVWDLEDRLAAAAVTRPGTAPDSESFPLR